MVLLKHQEGDIERISQREQTIISFNDIYMIQAQSFKTLALRFQFTQVATHFHCISIVSLNKTGSLFLGFH